jgi:hypothetical protein
LSEQEQKKQKKKKKKKQLVVLEAETVESELPELVEVLEELEREKKYVDIQVCPHCKSPNVRRTKSMEDVFGHMGFSPPKYECKKCGWRGKLVIKATNRPTTIKDVVIMAEANKAEREE